VSDRLKELGLAVNGISVGSQAQDQTKYKNIKAEAYWGARQWIKAGHKLQNENGFRQLIWTRYKVNTDKVLQIEPKEELKRRTGKSPDFAEAFMLTFAPPIPQPDIFFI